MTTRRTLLIPVRVSPEEAERYRARAAAAGTTLAALARAAWEPPAESGTVPA